MNLLKKDLGFFHDFSLPTSGLLKRNFVLPHDINKHLVWTTDSFLEQQLHCVRWFFRRVGFLWPKEQDFSLTIQVFEKLLVAVQAGISPLNIDELSAMISGFSSWIGLVSRSKRIFQSRGLVLMYACSLFMEYPDFYKIFSDFLYEKIEFVIKVYLKSRTAVQKLSRALWSKELTLWINNALEFDLIDNPKALLVREWKIWPLLYLGPTQATGDFMLDYELEHRIARGLPVDYISLIKKLTDDKEIAKTRYIRGILRRKVQNGRKDRPFWAGDAIKILIDSMQRISLIGEEDLRSSVCGGFDIYKDYCGRYFRLLADDPLFFNILSQLGLNPTILSRRQANEVYGSMETNRGFRLDVIDEPHALHFFGPKRLVKKDTVANLRTKVNKWQEKGANVLTIWWDLHSGGQPISVSSVRRVFKKLAENKVPLADKIYKKIKV